MYHRNGKRNFTAKINYQKGVLDATQKCRLMDTLETEFFAINKFMKDNISWLEWDDWKNCLDRMKDILSGYEILTKDVFPEHDEVIQRKWENMVYQLYLRGEHR